MKVLLAGALVGLVAANTQAAVISVQPVVAGYFDTDYNPIPVPPYYGGPGPGASVVIQVDVMMQVLSLAPGEDSFGLAAFNFELKSNCCPGFPGTIVPDTNVGWTPNTFKVDSNGASPGGVVPLFANNGDFGGDNMDLQGILVQMGTGAFTNAVDPRRNIGELGSPLGVPIRLGSAFLKWTGWDVAFTLSSVQVAAKLTNGNFVPGFAVPVETIRFGICPEPSSLVLMGCCLMGVVLRRRDG